MSDLKCRKCGIERTYADASIEDLRRTCGINTAVTLPNKSGSFGGDKHEWVEQ